MTAINEMKQYRQSRVRRKSRLKVVTRIVLAPLFYVGFADFWLADQMNSLAQAFKDFQFLVCFYIQRFR